MSIWEKVVSFDTGVYWSPRQTGGGSIESDRYGNRLYLDPVSLGIRWDDVVEQIVDAAGRDAKSKAQIFCSSQVEVGGVLWRGDLQNSPTKPPTDSTIIRVEVIKNIKLTKTLWLAYL